MHLIARYLRAEPYTATRMMKSNNWIDAIKTLNDSGQACILVTIIEHHDSTPRNTGSKMVVTLDAIHDTIGGGHLEYKAMKIAREMLQGKATETRMERFVLGASLGQCCGGAAVLLFEPLGHTMVQVAVFGAGHVGRALTPLLATLPCQIHWIDSREQEFPEQTAEGINCILTDDPVAEVSNMPPGSYYIVMTHNHQLDMEITEQILRRDDFAYFGLIGSQTKRNRFEHRLHKAGISQDVTQKMRCPMGIEQVKGKLPAEIAISIAGEIIATYNAEADLHKQHKQRKLKAVEPA